MSSKCPDCGGEGRIHGHYALDPSSLECPTCAPGEPLSPFTEAELDAFEKEIEDRIKEWSNGHRTS